MQAGVWPGVCDDKGARCLPICVGIAILKQRIELAAVALELGALVENLAENVLNLDHPGTDAEFSTKLFLQIRRCGQMVGMNVAFNNPLYGQDRFREQIGNQFISGFLGCSARMRNRNRARCHRARRRR